MSGFLLNNPENLYDVIGLDANDCICKVSNLLESGRTDQLKDLLKANIEFQGGAPKNRNRILNELVRIGSAGGDLGKAMLARTVCGDKLKINWVFTPASG